MADYRREIDDVLPFGDTPSAEELQVQVQKAHAELSELKRRAEQIEKDKQRLEELSRRQDEFESGRAEIVEKLTRSTATIERESEDTQKRLEQLTSIHQTFLRHIQTLEAIQPKNWTSQDLSKELSKALTIVDDARAEFNRAQATLITPASATTAQEAPDYEPYEPENEKGFFYWLIAGTAFTLPLTLVGVVGLLVWLWSLSTH